MSQRVKRAERKRRQRERQDALWRYLMAEVKRIASLPPLGPNDYIFTSADPK